MRELLCLKICKPLLTLFFSCSPHPSFLVIILHPIYQIIFVYTFFFSRLLSLLFFFVNLILPPLSLLSPFPVLHASED